MAEFTARGIAKDTLLDGYLMVELPWILERWRRKEAQQALLTLNLHSLPHWKDERERDKFVSTLRKQAYGEEPRKKSSADGLAALRAWRERNGRQK